MITKGKAFNTTQAAEFLTELGVPRISKGTLERMRRRLADDPADRGPDWYRRPEDRATVYFEADLRDYAQKRLGQMLLRQPTPDPFSRTRKGRLTT